MICEFQIYIVKKIIKLRKNSSFNWFTPFHVLIRPDVIWKKISRPLYHVHFTVIHTNSRHNDLEMSMSNMEFPISQPKVVRLPWNEKQTYRLNFGPPMWQMGLTLAMTSVFEFRRSNVTFWWPRSGVRIYQIVTGVTSDVSVPSTHLVSYRAIGLLYFKDNDTTVDTNTMIDCGCNSQ